MVRRFYYHVNVDACAEVFTHVVQSNDEDNGWIYEYGWVPLEQDGLPVLYGELGVYLDRLLV